MSVEARSNSSGQFLRVVDYPLASTHTDAQGRFTLDPRPTWRLTYLQVGAFTIRREELVRRLA